MVNPNYICPNNTPTSEWPAAKNPGFSIRLTLRETDSEKYIQVFAIQRYAIEGHFQIIKIFLSSPQVLKIQHAKKQNLWTYAI